MSLVSVAGRVRSAGLSLPHEVSAVRTARNALERYLYAHDVEADPRHDARLVLSELISNAIRHAPPTTSGGLTVNWGVDERNIYIEVTDGRGPTEPQQVSQAHPEAIGGRGLAIVDTLTSSWGVHHDTGDRTVYAVLSR